MSDDDDQEFNFQNTDIVESTDMKVDMFANSDKLINKDERWYFSKDDNNVNNNVDDANNANNANDVDYTNNTNNANNDEVDEDINAYKKNQTNNSEQDIDSKVNRANGGNGGNGGESKDDDEYESLSPNEKRLRRLEYMRKLGEIRDLGCKITNYSINDDYYMMKYEYELHTSIRTKRNWMQLYNHILIGAVKGVELVNNRYNPFDISLKGLSNEVSADKNTYYEILGEIYEHYNVPGKKMNPWMRLFVTLIGTVVIVGGKNNAHKLIPTFANKLENDEELLDKLRAKATSNNQPQQYPQQYPQHQQSQQQQSQYQQSQQQQSQQSQHQQSQHQQSQQSQTKSGFDDLFEKEHNNTVQKIKDLEELKRQELEYQQLQKLLADDEDKFSKIKQRFEMSQQSPLSQQSPNSQQSNHSDNKKTNHANTTSKRQLQQSVVRDTDTRSTLSNQSSRSVISVNKTLQNKLNNNTIKASSISFGSFAKGKKTNVKAGS